MLWNWQAKPYTKMYQSIKASGNTLTRVSRRHLLKTLASSYTVLIVGIDFTKLSNALKPSATWVANISKPMHFCLTSLDSPKKRICDVWQNQQHLAMEMLRSLGMTVPYLGSFCCYSWEKYPAISLILYVF